MGRLLTLYSNRASSSASRLILAGNRNRIPYTTGSTTNFMKYYGAAMRSPANTDTNEIEVVFDNFLALNNAGISTTGLIDFKVWCGIEPVIGGTVYPLSLSGDINPLVSVGSRVVMKAAPSVTIPANSVYRLRWDQYHQGVVGTSSYTQLHNMLFAPGRNDHATSGTDPLVIKAHGGVTYPAFGTVTLAYGPTAVRGKAVTPGQKSVLLALDSIGRGSGDSISTTQQGDWLSGTSPSTDYPNHGNIGWAERSLGAAYPYFNLSVPGRLVQTFTQSNLDQQLAVLDNARPSFVLLGLAVNDLMAGRTPTQIIADLKAAITLMKARYGSGVPFAISTPGPVTNSTDGWATTTNQTFTGTPGGATVVWGNFDDASGATGRLALIAQLLAGDHNADFILPVHLSVQDATDPRKHRVDLGTPTGDGIHHRDVIVKRIKSDINLPSYIN